MTAQDRTAAPVPNITSTQFCPMPRKEPKAATHQDGVFRVTDPVPPLRGYTFDAEDIEELGLDLCIKVAERVRGRRAK